MTSGQKDRVFEIRSLRSRRVHGIARTERMAKRFAGLRYPGALPRDTGPPAPAALPVGRPRPSPAGWQWVLTVRSLQGAGLARGGQELPCDRSGAVGPTSARLPDRDGEDWCRLHETGLSPRGPAPTAGPSGTGPSRPARPASHGSMRLRHHPERLHPDLLHARSEPREALPCRACPGDTGSGLEIPA